MLQREKKPKSKNNYMYRMKDIMRINNIKSFYCQQQDKKVHQCQKSLMHKV